MTKYQSDKVLPELNVLTGKVFQKHNQKKGGRSKRLLMCQTTSNHKYQQHTNNRHRDKLLSVNPLCHCEKHF